MKKFDRLPAAQRKEEIQQAALQLFIQKGFAATTMENIVAQVSLSKGGVYRLYPSTTAILSDIMLQGMQLRNAYYAQHVQALLAEGHSLDAPALVDMIIDSLLLYPDISAVYVEFLWEKQRHPELETLYQALCTTTIEATTTLIHQYGADALLLADAHTLQRLTDIMNAAILSLHVLHLEDAFEQSRASIREAMLRALHL